MRRAFDADDSNRLEHKPRLKPKLEPKLKHQFDIGSRGGGLFGKQKKGSYHD